MIDKVFTKIEVAAALRDAYRTIEYCLSEEGKKCNFFDGYTHVISQDNNPRVINNFNTTFIFFLYFLLIKHFVTTYEEGQFDLVNDVIDLSGIIFVEPKPINLSGKKMIKYFRNALSHNDNPEHELYRFINKDGHFYLEINLLKLGPLHILLDFNTFYNLILQVNKNKKMCIQELINFDENNISYENCVLKLSEAKIRQYESTKEFDFNDKVKVYDLKSKKLITKKEVIEKYSKVLSVSEYDLSLEQKNLIKEQLLKFDKYGVNYDFNYILNYIQPSAKNKLNEVEKMFEIIYYCTINKTRSYTETLLYLMKQSNYLDNTMDLFGLLDKEYLISIARSIYSSYIYDTLVLDDKVKIGDKEYDRNRIRNSFTHMRWINRKKSYTLFDWEDNRKENHLDKLSIKFNDLQIANDEYYYNKLKESNVKYVKKDNDLIIVLFDENYRVGFKDKDIFIYSNINLKDNNNQDKNIYICGQSGIRLAALEEAKCYKRKLKKCRNNIINEQLNKKFTISGIDNSNEYIAQLKLKKKKRC